MRSVTWPAEGEGLGGTVLAHCYFVNKFEGLGWGRRKKKRVTALIDVEGRDF